MLLALLVAPVPDWWAIVVIVAAVPFLGAWGHFHADLELNGALDETARNRWRMALWILPWSMALYWLLYVRPRGGG